MYKNYKYGVGFLTLLPLALALSVSRAAAQVVPTAIDGTVVNQTGNQFGIVGGQVSGDGTNLFHSFDRFGLSQGQVADFLANPQIRNIFGRVVGGEASAIDGLLKVSGGSANLFLMNPSGILFGPNARLDIPAAFTATTANGIGFGGGWFSASGVNDYGRLLGSPNALSFGLPQSGAIANFGQLAVGQGQSLSLVGGTVLNLGALSAAGGNVTVAAVAGKQVARISPVGSLLSVEVPLTVGGQANEWKLPVGSLPQLLTGAGVGEANGVAVRPDGSIVLTASGKGVMAGSGDTIVSGKVDVSGSGVGGSATIVGDRLALVGATVEASGGAGGGNVRVGGEFQGKGAIPNASRTFVSNDSIISANSTRQGDGGRVIVWADKDTNFSGNATARAGESGGNGGFVEISGKQNLAFQGKVNVAAPLGELGTVLFDPRNLYIVDTVDPAIGPDNSNQLNVNVPNPGDPLGSILLADVGVNTDFQITKTALEGISGNITLEASGDINLKTSLKFEPQIGLNSQIGRTIKFTADGDFNGGAESVKAAGQNINITASSISLNEIDTTTNSFLKAGDVTLNALSDSKTSGYIKINQILASSETTTVNAGQGGGVNIIASNNIDLIAVKTRSESKNASSSSAGAVTIESQKGGVSFSQSIDALSITGEARCESPPCNSSNGGAVKITTAQDLVIGNTEDFGIYTFTQSPSGKSGNGGDVTLTSTAGSISVGKIETFASTTNSNQGVTSGNVTLDANKSIKVLRNINAAAVEQNKITIPGGQIFQDFPANIDNVQNYPLHTQDLGIGGTVSLTANETIQVQGQYFRYDFIDGNGVRKYFADSDSRCQGASICTSGQGRSGDINIVYGKSLATDPGFTIGSPLINGTSGTLVSGSRVQAGNILPPIALIGGQAPGNIQVASKVPPTPPCVVDPAKCISLAVNTIEAPQESKNPKLIDELVSSGKLDKQFVNSLEDRFTSEYEQFLGVKAPKSMNVQQIQDRLQTIDRETKTQNVLVYLFLKGNDIRKENNQFTSKPNIWEWFTCRSGSKDKNCSPLEKDKDKVIEKLSQIKSGKISYSKLTKEEKDYLFKIEKRQAGISLDASSEDTLGMSVVTAKKVFNIPFIHKETGCPLFYKPTSRNALSGIDLPDFDGKSCQGIKVDLDQIGEHVVKRKNLSLKPILMSENRNIVDLLNTFRQESTRKIATNDDKLKRLFKDSSEMLYKWLIQPFKRLIMPQSAYSMKDDQCIKTSSSGDYHLSFMLDPSLGAFPIGALRTQNQDANRQDKSCQDKDLSEFLIEEASVSFMPSFSLVDSRLLPKAKALKDLSILAMGASNFTNDQVSLPLKVEIDSINKVWCQDRFDTEEACKNSQFFDRTEDFIADRLGGINRQQVSLIHLTTHGKFDAENPYKSHIYIAKSDSIKLGKTTQASQFPLSEVRKLKLNFPPPQIELLFLSACETANSSSDAPEFGFAGEAFRSRVKSIIAITDKVSPEATLVLSALFYDKLRNSPTTKAQALRNAQIEMIKSHSLFETKLNKILHSENDNYTPKDKATLKNIKTGNFNSSINWANFILIGNPW